MQSLQFYLSRNIALGFGASQCTVQALHMSAGKLPYSLRFDVGGEFVVQGFEIL